MTGASSRFRWRKGSRPDDGRRTRASAGIATVGAGDAVGDRAGAVLFSELWICELGDQLAAGCSVARFRLGASYPIRRLDDRPVLDHRSVLWLLVVDLPD